MTMLQVRSAEGPHLSAALFNEREESIFRCMRDVVDIHEQLCTYEDRLYYSMSLVEAFSEKSDEGLNLDKNDPALRSMLFLKKSEFELKNFLRQHRCEFVGLYSKVRKDDKQVFGEFMRMMASGITQGPQGLKTEFQTLTEVGNLSVFVFRCAMSLRDEMCADAHESKDRSQVCIGVDSDPDVLQNLQKGFMPYSPLKEKQIRCLENLSTLISDGSVFDMFSASVCSALPLSISFCHAYAIYREFIMNKYALLVFLNSVQSSTLGLKDVQDREIYQRMNVLCSSAGALVAFEMSAQTGMDYVQADKDEDGVGAGVIPNRLSDFFRELRIASSALSQVLAFSQHLPCFNGQNLIPQSRGFCLEAINAWPNLVDQLKTEGVENIHIALKREGRLILERLFKEYQSFAQLQKTCIKNLKLLMINQVIRQDVVNSLDQYLAAVGRIEAQLTNVLAFAGVRTP